MAFTPAALAQDQAAEDATERTLMSEAEALDRILGHEDSEVTAYLHLHDIMGDYMSPNDVSELSFVAYHNVAGVLCRGVFIDAERSAASIASVRPDNFDQFTAEEQRHWQDVALVNFGMIFGVMLAEKTGRESEFCDEVYAIINDRNAAWHLFDVDEYAAAMAPTDQEQAGGGE